MKEPTRKKRSLTASLPADVLEWLEAWERGSGQPRSLVVRAALRLLKAVIEPHEPWDKVQLIADLAGSEEDSRKSKRLQALFERIAAEQQEAKARPPGRRPTKP